MAGGYHSTTVPAARLTALRPVLASLLLAVLAAGGVALPTVHLAAHGLEAAAERAEHGETAHGEAGDHVQTPCAPAPHHVDCAVCTGVAAADLAQADGLAASDPAEVISAYADWTRAATAAGAGARAPPIG